MLTDIRINLESQKLNHRFKFNIQLILLWNNIKRGCINGFFLFRFVFLFSPFPFSLTLFLINATIFCIITCSYTSISSSCSFYTSIIIYTFVFWSFTLKASVWICVLVTGCFYWNFIFAFKVFILWSRGRVFSFDICRWWSFNRSLCFVTKVDFARNIFIYTPTIAVVSKSFSARFTVIWLSVCSLIIIFSFREMLRRRRRFASFSLDAFFFATGVFLSRVSDGWGRGFFDGRVVWFPMDAIQYLRSVTGKQDIFTRRIITFTK